MAKSNKPIFWSLFAAGGTLTAFLLPVLVLLTLLAALGWVPSMLSYEKLHGFAAGWFGKLALFFVVSLSLWHAAHRTRVTMHDFGVRSDKQVALAAYSIAGLGTLATIAFLLRM